MALNARKAPKAGGDRETVEQPVLPPAGYPGRVVQVIDFGLQEQTPFEGKAKPPANEIYLGYELLDEFMVDEDGKPREDKPRWVSETLPLRNLDADKAKSTQRYYALDPTEVYEGDFTKLLETACIVNLIKKAGKGKNAGKVYNNIDSLGTMREKDAAKAPGLKNPTKLFTLEDPDIEVFRSLPDWMQLKIKGNLEFNGSKLQKLLGVAPEVEQDDAEVDYNDTPDEGDADGSW